MIGNRASHRVQAVRAFCSQATSQWELWSWGRGAECVHAVTATVSLGIAAMQLPFCVRLSVWCFVLRITLCASDAVNCTQGCTRQRLRGRRANAALHRRGMGGRRCASAACRHVAFWGERRGPIAHVGQRQRWPPWARRRGAPSVPGVCPATRRCAHRLVNADVALPTDGWRTSTNVTRASCA